jgi:riboflavin synthase
MFTGIIEGLGTIGKIATLPEGGARLILRLPSSLAQQPHAFQLGDSVAINGACLTVVEIGENTLSFDTVPETLKRTNLGDLQPSDIVNLERALTPETRLGGHFVQGHIDTTAIIESIRPEGNARVFRFRLNEKDFMRYIVPKGSIAIDGVSLTVVEVGDDWFTVWIVPFTWEHTNFYLHTPDDHVNIETDILARYVEKLVAAF